MMNPLRAAAFVAALLAAPTGAVTAREMVEREGAAEGALFPWAAEERVQPAQNGDAAGALFPWAVNSRSQPAQGHSLRAKPSRISLLQMQEGLSDQAKQAYSEIEQLEEAQELDPKKAGEESAEVRERDAQLTAEVSSLHNRLENVKGSQAQLQELFQQQQDTLGQLRAQARESRLAAQKAQQLAQTTAWYLKVSLMGTMATGVLLAVWVMVLNPLLPDKGQEQSQFKGSGEPAKSHSSAEPQPASEGLKTGAGDGPAPRERPRSRPRQTPGPPREPPRLSAAPGTGEAPTPPRPAVPPLRLGPQALSAAVAARAGVRSASASKGSNASSRASSTSVSRCEFFTMNDPATARGPAACHNLETEEDKWWGTTSSAADHLETVAEPSGETVAEPSREQMPPPRPRQAAPSQSLIPLPPPLPPPPPRRQQTACAA